jgi:hypothetical protein
MASTHAKAVRRAGVLQRLSSRLGVQPVDLHANAKGDSEMALIMTLERIADAIDTNVQAQERGDLRSVLLAASDDELVSVPGIGDKSLASIREWAASEPEAQEAAADATHDQQAEQAAEESAPVPPVTVETVEEKPLETIETVEIVPADEAPNPVLTDMPKPKGKAK